MKMLFDKIKKLIISIKESNFLSNNLIKYLKQKKYLLILSITLVVIIIAAISTTIIYNRKLKDAEKLASVSQKILLIFLIFEKYPHIDEDEKDEFIFPSEGKRPYAVM